MRREHVLVAECTPGSDGWCAVLSHALLALFGDRTCAAPNVQRSCFGAEWCDRGLDPQHSSPRFVLDLLRHNTCYVALDARSRTFLGVIAVSRDATIHTFCVLPTARGKGVGRALLTRAIRQFGRKPLALTVAGPTGSSPAARVLVQRRDQLLSFYQSYGFRPTGAVDRGYIAMERARCLR